MIRPLALFLAVVFSVSAAFLVLPDQPPRLAGVKDDASEEGAPVHRGRPSFRCGPAPRAAAGADQRIAPRRYDEVAVDEKAVLEIVREDGRPIADAGVRMVKGGEGPEPGIQEAVTDASGRVTLPAEPDTAAFVTVSRSDFVAHADLVSIAPGTRRLVVPDRKKIEARVLVRGQVPSAPILIGLNLPMGIARLSAMSDARGNVEFFNIPDGVVGNFTWPAGYRRDESTPSEIPLTRLPTEAEWRRSLSGRLAMPITGKLTPLPANDRIADLAVLGVPGDIEVGTFLNPSPPAAPAEPQRGWDLRVASYRLTPTSVDAPVRLANEVIAAVTNDQNAAAPTTVHLSFSVENAQLGGLSSFVVPTWGKPAGTASDPNEIRLIPTRSIPIRILDPSGAPVRATASANEGASWCAAPDENGRTVLTLDEDVFASGFASAISVSHSPTMAGLPIQHVAMSWDANGAVSATVTVGYPPETPEHNP